jgi:hypothetical protein
LTIPGVLFGVASTSASNAWAVGFVPGSTGTPTTLLLRWNGTRWSQVTNPKPVYGTLTGVTVVSADNVWAVGWTSTTAGADDTTLIMHWNGKRWSVQAGAARFPGELYAVAARGNSVWAVGATHNLEDPLILHGAGNRWYVVPSEAPAPSRLYGIAVTGNSTVWADGVYQPYRGLLLRWNGAIWKSVPSPLQSPHNFLNALAAGPAGAVWAVGADWNSKTTAATATSMLWNGKTWRKVPVGSFSGPVVVLDAVTFVPGGTAWAVGYNSAVSLLLRWTGHEWIPVANPEDRSDSSLYGVAATSVSNAWAVGYGEVGDQAETLILHWNGKAWS